MKILDLKDRKILHQLDIDSRQSASQIGKKVGLNRDVVSNRIKKLQRKGIIENFYTVIDASRLGYISFRFYFVFQSVTTEEKQEIIDYFVNNKYTYFVGSLEGLYDLCVIMWVKNVMDFYSFYKKMLKKYGCFFKEINFCLYIRLIHFRCSFLIDEPDDREKFLITGGKNKVDIDDLDIQILKIIAANARIPTVEVAKKLDTTAMIVKYRINKLIKNGVIQGFKTNIDFLKLGYQNFKVDIYFNDYKDIDKITKYIKSNPHLFYIDETAGHSDLEIEFYVETINSINQIMEDLTTRFPRMIRYYTIFNTLRFIKRQFMPELSDICSIITC